MSREQEGEQGRKEKGREKEKERMGKEEKGEKEKVMPAGFAALVVS